MKAVAGHLRILLGFAALTVVLTLPLAFDLGSAVKDLGDPLLNSWILAWETHSLFDPEAGSFFDTNIFYPHRNTLAYSEMLIPQLVLAAPAILWSGNPVLAHNLVLWASFLATAMGAYLLAFHLTGDRRAAVCAGMILAFCPFMISHLSHVQILFAAGIPLSFLCLHRFLDHGRTRDAVLLALAWATQMLANAYYAVYLSFFLGLYLFLWIIRQRRWARRRLWLQLALVAGILLVLVGPFFWRYFRLQEEMGFRRWPPAPTPIFAFLATPASNLLYGEITAPFGRPEAELFPGLVALGLAAVALRSRLRWSEGGRRWPRFARPAYPLILILSFVLVLGTGPYRFLYKWVPGFGSLRAVPRIHVMFMFALAVLAAEGCCLLLRRASSNRRRRFLAIGIPLLIGLEYLSVPLPMVRAPQAREFPVVHHWLAAQEDDPVIAAYPMRLRDEWSRVYFSTLHWRRMVNGFSGFLPPLYEELVARGRRLPTQETLGELHGLGADLIVVETPPFGPKRLRRWEKKARRRHHLRRVAELGAVRVYRFQGGEPNGAAIETRAGEDWIELDRRHLTVRTSHQPERAPRMLDGDRGSLWQAPMRPGEWLEIELAEAHLVGAVELDVGALPRDYPRGYRLEASADGDRWQTIAEEPSLRPPLAGFLRPTELRLRLPMPPTPTRFLRLTQTGKARTHWWSIGELRVLIEPDTAVRADTRPAPAAEDFPGE